jgi:hypothetical protein
MIKNYDQAVAVIESKPDIFGTLKHPERFMHYLPQNMHIYVVVERYAFQLRNKGKRDVYAIQAIVQRLRWDSYFAEVDSQYKINNFHSAFIARLVMAANPELEGLFRIREHKPELDLLGDPL